MTMVMFHDNGDPFPPQQASTLDGVLGLKNEHFWTIAFGSYVSRPHILQCKVTNNGGRGRGV